MSDLTDVELTRMLMEAFCPYLSSHWDQPNFIVAAKWGPHAALYASLSHLDDRHNGWVTITDLRQAAAKALSNRKTNT